MHIEGLRFKDKKAIILNQKILVAEHCQESSIPVFCAHFPSPGAIPKIRLSIGRGRILPPIHFQIIVFNGIMHFREGGWLIDKK